MVNEIQPKTTQSKWLKVSQFFAAYLVAAWTFLQFLDWILKRYNISPHWVDLMLWLFIGIIPSLLIYLYHKERINKRVFRRREKIIFPLNAVVLTIALYFGFGDNDLGATTQTINYTTSLGGTKTALITKEEFRTEFAIFNFEPKTKDSTRAWLETGIPKLLCIDLLQNKNLNPFNDPYNKTTDKIIHAKSYPNDSYVDGEFEIRDSLFILTAFIRNSVSAKVIQQETFKGNDLLNLIDSITVYVTNYFTPIKTNKPDYVDLNIRDFTSNSIKAIEYYTKSDYKNAIKEDSTFALAYLAYVYFSLNQNIGKLEERKLADKAYEYRDKLPIQKQGETLILKNLAWDQLENAEKLTKIQLAIDPSDATYNAILYLIYGRTKNIKACADLAYRRWKNEKSVENAFLYYYASLGIGDFKKAMNAVNMLEQLLPNYDKTDWLIIMPQLLNGDIKAASETLNKIKLLHPDSENLTKVYDKALAYLKDHKVTKEEMQKFEGEYRINVAEMTITCWIENNKLLQYASNQEMWPLIIGGDSTLIGGFSDGMTIEETFFQNDDAFYLIKCEQNYLSQTSVFWYWKIDDSIIKAEALLEAGKLDSAEIAYTTAIEANPNHYYLKDALAHINYVKNIDSIALINQYKEVAGTYGPRIFWVEDGKLYYSRTDIKSYGQVQLLPISKTRYINLTRIANSHDFEFKDGKVIASFYWDFDCEKMEWVKYDGEGHSFAKDENEPDAITKL